MHLNLNSIQFTKWFREQLPPVPTLPADIHTTCCHYFWLLAPEAHRAKHLSHWPNTCISGDAFNLLVSLGIDPLTDKFPALDEGASPVLKELVATWMAERMGA